MGLFDAFSGKDSQQRQELLDLLVQQANDERTRVRTARSVIIARTASARDWLETNRAPIAAGYGQLLDAFFSRDPAATMRVMRGLGNRLGIVAAMPIYLSDGVSTVTFTDLAEKVFASNAGIAYTLKQATPVLPESAYTTRAASEFFVAEKPLTTIVADNPGLMARLSGNHREDQQQWINHYTQVLERLKINGPSALREAETEQAAMVQSTIAHITATVTRRHALLSAFDNGIADGAVNTLKALAEQKLLPEILAMGTGRDDATDFTALSLTAFEDRAEATRVYSTLLEHGAKPLVDTVLAQSFIAENPLPPAALAATLTAVERDSGKDAARALAITSDESGTPYLTRAFNDSTRLDVLLAPFKTPLARAGALLAAADQTSDAAQSATIRKAAMTIAGAPFLALTDLNRVRLDAIGAVALDGKSLRYRQQGEIKTANMGDADNAAAALTVLARQPGFVQLSDKLIINLAHVPALRFHQERGSKDTIVYAYMRGENIRRSLNAEQLETLTAALKSTPGWHQAKDSWINAPAADLVLLQRSQQPGTLFLRGHGKGVGFEVAVPQADGEKMMQDLAALPGQFIGQTNALYAPSRAAMVRVEPATQSTAVVKWSFNKYDAEMKTTIDMAADIM
ncbi:MAG: hypothetical protein KKA05_00905, partial [Alphaproteobacteria bacterium]|nr:hypothetical protein [Alphaproteobacteria bacterium]